MINLILVDDEPLALERFEQMLVKFKEINIIDTHTNPLDALQSVSINQAHGIFIDIDMPQLNGIELAVKIKEKNPYIHLIFATAYEEFALKAFEIHALDYLLKPVSKQRLETTINRIIKNQFYTDLDVLEKSNPKIQVQLDGKFKVFDVHGEEVTRWKTNKVKELFAILVSRLNHKESRDHLMKMLWPKSTYMSAKTNLHTNISYLKKDLQRIGIDNLISYSDEYYSIDMEHIDMDISPLYTILSSREPIEKENVKMFEWVLEKDVLDVMASYKNKIWFENYYHEILTNYINVLQDLLKYYKKNDEDEKCALVLKKIAMYQGY